MEETNYIIPSNHTHVVGNFFDELRMTDYSDIKTIVKVFGLYFIILLISYYENTLLLNRENKKAVIEPEIKITPEKEFSDKEMRFFEKIYEEKEGFDPNENMDEEFYNLELYKETVAKENSDFEKKWKTKILNMTTPRGNISMHYDVYKMGFAYYSESSFVPYDVLNTLAMKYVRIFRCRDLFFDNKITPINKESPLIKLRKEETVKEKEKNIQSSGITPINKDRLKNGPFAKLKNYKLEENPNKKKDDATTGNVDKPKTIPTLIYNVNLFIYMGKHANFSFIHRVPKKRVFAGMKSKFSDLFDGEHAVQTENMNYKDFKKALSKKQNVNNNNTNDIKNADND